MSYNTSKSAVLQMARSMACELGPKGIRVNTLSPGHIYTSYVKTLLQCDWRRRRMRGLAVGAYGQIGVNINEMNPTARHRDWGAVVNLCFS